MYEIRDIESISINIQKFGYGDVKPQIILSTPESVK